MNILLNSWNRASPRFIDAPAFAWQAVPGAEAYAVAWSQGPSTGSARVSETAFDFGPAWSGLACGQISWSVRALDAAGAALDESSFSFYKAPDFDGEDEAALDWRAAAKANLDFLLKLPRDSASGQPWYLRRSWHLNPEKHAAYPCLHYPSFIFLFLETLPDAGEELRPRLEAALKEVCDAALAYRVPGGRGPLQAPFSAAISRDPVWPEAEERQGLTLFRTARLGEALWAAQAYAPRPELRAFALEIADYLLKLQRPDGSFPFRIRPETGEVLQDYTSAVICCVPFLEAVAKAEGGRYGEAASRALAWTREQPCRTLRWEGMYEDVFEPKPYANLENWDAMDAVRLFSRDDSALAQRLNRWVEDQFVAFGPIARVTWSQVPTPAVYEQYVCFYPMEVHAARWIQALEALWRATGEESYRRKARRAANAIVRSQYPDGRFSTWGRSLSDGKPLNEEGDWYGCNACAAQVLWDLGKRLGEPAKRS